MSLWLFAGLSPAAAHAAVDAVTARTGNGTFHGTSDYGIRHERAWENLGQEHAGMAHGPNWHDVKPTVVHYDHDHPDFEGIYATQDWVRPDSLHHNISHPGEHEPGRSGMDASDHYDRSEGDDGHNGAPTDLPRYYRHPAGGLALMDGHHRVVADHVMGAASGMGRVWDDDEHGSHHEHLHKDDEEDY